MNRGRKIPPPPIRKQLSPRSRIMKSPMGGVGKRNKKGGIKSDLDKFEAPMLI